MTGRKSKALTHTMNGAISSCLVGLLTQPFNVIKTSIMMNYKNGRVVTMFEIVKRIIKEEGYSGFYRGLVPSMVKTTTGTAIYLGTLETIKEKLTNYYELGGENQNCVNFFSAGFARTVQSIILNPLVVIKTRFEVIGFNSYSSMTDGLRKIFREEGAKGYFKGLSQTLTKEVPYAAFVYVLYEFFKKFYSSNLSLNNTQIQASISSLTANFILTVLTNPVDVIRARVQYRHFSKNENHDYKGVISGTIKLAKDEGIRGLSAGLMPRFMKKAIGSSLVWMIYETLKKNTIQKDLDSLL